MISPLFKSSGISSYRAQSLQKPHYDSCRNLICHMFSFFFALPCGPWYRIRRQVFTHSELMKQIKVMFYIICFLLGESAELRECFFVLRHFVLLLSLILDECGLSSVLYQIFPKDRLWFVVSKMSGKFRHVCRHFLHVWAAISA